MFFVGSQSSSFLSTTKITFFLYAYKNKIIEVFFNYFLKQKYANTSKF